MIAIEKIIDSSVLLDYVINGNYKELIEDKNNGISVLSLFEIKKKMLAKNYAEQDIQKVLRFMRQRTIVIEIGAELAEKAAEVAHVQKLSMADALIYTTAQLKNAQLISCDNDFRNLPNAMVLDK